jgi:hypothetical protein
MDNVQPKVIKQYIYCKGFCRSRQQNVRIFCAFVVRNFSAYNNFPKVEYQTTRKWSVGDKIITTNPSGLQQSLGFH